MSIPTFTPFVYADQKRKDGTYNIKIRIVFKRKSRKIATGIFAHPSELTRSLKPKDAVLKNKIQAEILRIQDAVSEISAFSLRQMDITQLVEHITSSLADEGEFRLNFMEYWEDVVRRTKTGKPLANYLSALRSFRVFCGKDIYISDVTYNLLTGYEAHLVKTHGAKARAVSLYTSAVRYVFTQARLEFNDYDKNIMRIPHNPFERYRCPKQVKAAHRNIELELIQQMILRRAELEGRMRLAVDVYLISFALMGMNAPDLYDCKPAKDGIITYNRTKTRGRRDDDALHRVRIEPQAAGIIGEYSDRTGKKQFSFRHRYCKYTELSRAVNIGLKEYCDRYGLDKFTLYSARHSWATLARNQCGVDMGTIGKCLCHVSRTHVQEDTYVNFDWEEMWKANAKVLELFEWGN